MWKVSCSVVLKRQLTVTSRCSPRRARTKNVRELFVTVSGRFVIYVCSHIPVFFGKIAAFAYHGASQQHNLSRAYEERLLLMRVRWWDIIPPRSGLVQLHEYPLKPAYGDRWGKRGQGKLGLQSFTAASRNTALFASKLMIAHIWMQACPCYY